MEVIASFVSIEENHNGDTLSKDGLAPGVNTEIVQACLITGHEMSSSSNTISCLLWLPPGYKGIDICTHLFEY